MSWLGLPNCLKCPCFGLFFLLTCSTVLIHYICIALTVLCSSFSHATIGRLCLHAIILLLFSHCLQQAKCRIHKSNTFIITDYNGRMGCVVLIPEFIPFIKMKTPLSRSMYETCKKIINNIIVIQDFRNKTKKKHNNKTDNSILTNETLKIINVINFLSSS